MGISLKTISNAPFVSNLKKDLKPSEIKGLHLDTTEFKRLPKKVTIDHYLYATTHLEKAQVLINPNHTAVVEKKIKNVWGRTVAKEPVEINVASSSNEVFDFYHFLEKGTNKEIGYVQLFNSKKALVNEEASKYYYTGRFSRNYPGYGLSKDRVVIEMAYNNSEGTYGGIGKLVDKLAVEYAMKNGIKPTSIISEAGFSSHVQHYQRGRRFMPENGKSYNRIVRDKINSSLPGQKIECNDIWDILMYFPKTMVNRLVADIKANPILKD